ncbi:hypothetical protein JCM8097_001573 [Rhodosporidiobolus ruineniae]
MPSSPAATAPPMNPLERTVSHGVVQHQLHDADGVDELTYPQLTQAGPPTDAYLETSPSGLVLASEAESRLPPVSNSSHSRRGSGSTLVSPSGGARPIDLEKGGKEVDAKLVTFRPDDPENPRNWSKASKWVQTAIPTLLCFLSGFASSLVTGGIPEMAAHYHVGELVMNLIVCVFVVGFGLGPLVLSPLSEMYGRKWIYIFCTWAFMLLTLPGCLTNSFAVMIIFRFFAGCAASACMCNAAGSIGDCWEINERGYKMAAFSGILFLSPCFGPLIGGYMTMGTGWRSFWWLLFAFAGFCGLIATFFLRETYHPTILKKRAQKLRKETGDESIMTEQERQGRSLGEIAHETLLRPLVMLATEPIMQLFAGYLALIYSLLYSLFFAYPIVFLAHSFNAGEIGLTFLSVAIGIVIVSSVGIPLQEKYYMGQVAKLNGGIPPPEARLPLMMVCSILLPISEFIFAATSMPKVHWAGALVSGIPFGVSLVGIYVSANTYIAVAFSKYSASAMAAKTLFRSMAGASIPMWLGPMYASIGNLYAGITFACISLVMAPIPFVFFFYGAKIRARSTMAS